MVCMSSSLISFKNEGFLKFCNALERFGVDLKSKIFYRFFMIFVSPKLFFFWLAGGGETGIFLVN